MSNLINIKVENDQLLVSSLEVAENFGKEHKHIREAIKNLTVENSTVKHLFYETTYKNSRGKQYPMYYMNRDGFSLLVMGFNGKKALEWKLKYINAFNEMEKKLNDPNYLAERLITYFKNKCNELTLENNVQKQQIAELQPKATYYDVVLNCEDVVTISLIAKDYGWSGKKMNEYLHKKRVQYKQNGTWLLYQNYAEKGFTHTKTPTTTDRNGVEHAHVHTYWTQKGRLFIYDLLKNDGIFPLIERED